MLGIELMPWQLLVAGVALEHDCVGRMAYRDVVVSTPRQSGKSTLLLPLIVYRMLAAPDQRVVYGAQTRLAARGKLFDSWWPRVRRSPLRDLFTLSRAMGAETLRCSNGSMLTILSTEESAGHGETIDMAVLDECWALSAASEQATRPAMATRPEAQLWCVSTAGTDKSVWWRSRVDAGRAQAELGMTQGLAYFEWSPAEGVDVTDPEAWPSFMPALGWTIDAATVQADMATMPPAEWKRAYANMWPDETESGWSVISLADWKRATE